MIRIFVSGGRDHLGCLDGRPFIRKPWQRAVNDWATDKDRQSLKRFIPLLPGTVDDEADALRAEYLLFAFHKFLRGWTEQIQLVSMRGIIWKIPEIIDHDHPVNIVEIILRSTYKLMRFGNELSRYKRTTMTPMSFDPSVLPAESLTVTIITLPEDVFSFLRDALEVCVAIGKRSPEWDFSKVPERVKEFERARA